MSSAARRTKRIIGSRRSVRSVTATSLRSPNRAVRRPECCSTGRMTSARPFRRRRDGRPCLDIIGISFNPKQKIGAGQKPFKRRADTGLEVSVGSDVLAENPVFVASVEVAAVRRIGFSPMTSVLVLLLLTVGACVRSRAALQLEAFGNRSSGSALQRECRLRGGFVHHLAVLTDGEAEPL